MSVPDSVKRNVVQGLARNSISLMVFACRVAHYINLDIFHWLWGEFRQEMSGMAVFPVCLHQNIFSRISESANTPDSEFSYSLWIFQCLWPEISLCL